MAGLRYSLTAAFGPIVPSLSVFVTQG